MDRGHHRHHDHLKIDNTEIITASIGVQNVHVGINSVNVRVTSHSSVV